MTSLQDLVIQKSSKFFEISSAPNKQTYVCLGQLPLLHFLYHSAISKADEQAEAVVRIHPAINRSILDKMAQTGTMQMQIVVLQFQLTGQEKNLQLKKKYIYIFIYSCCDVNSECRGYAGFPDTLSNGILVYPFIPGEKSLFI